MPVKSVAKLESFMEINPATRQIKSVYMERNDFYDQTSRF